MIIQYVYAIAAGNAVKFGVAKNPHARLEQLQTGCPDELVLLGSVKIRSYPGALSNAVLAESSIHRVCEAQRLRGEWFKNDPIVQLIIQMMNLGNSRLEFVNFLFGQLQRPDPISYQGWKNAPRRKWTRRHEWENCFGKLRYART